jgi:hypothetical protein
MTDDLELKKKEEVLTEVLGVWSLIMMWATFTGNKN